MAMDHAAFGKLQKKNALRQNVISPFVPAA